MNEQPEFLRLTQDLVFKSFFSRNKQVLLSLLRSFLPINGTISDVEILNPEERDQQGNIRFVDQLHIVDSAIPPIAIGKKLIVMDLRLKLLSGENINVEVQTFSQKGFLKRVLYYWSRLYNEDLEEGEDFQKVPPAYSLIFTTFTVLDKKITDCVNDSSIRVNKPPHYLVSRDFTMVTVELNKFKKEYTKLLDLQDIWCYLLLHSNELTAKAYKHLTRNKEARMALEHLSKISEDQRLRQAAITREKTRRDHYSRLANAKKEGIAKGMEKGIAKTALKMLEEDFDLPMVSKITGLSEADIKRIATEKD